MEKVGVLYFLDGTEEEVLEILKESGFFDYLETLPNEAARQQKLNEAKESMRQAVEELRPMKINHPDGEPSIILGKYHMTMHVIVRSVVVTGGRIALAYFLAPAGLAAGALMGESFDVAQSSWKIAKAIRKLNDEELQVYQAMLEVIDQRRHIIFKEPGSNADEVQQVLGDIETGAPNAAVILSRLEDEKRVKKHKGENEKEYFTPVW
jgi:hypothetical protein